MAYTSVVKRETRKRTRAMSREKREALLEREGDDGRARRAFMEVADRGFDLSTHGEACWARNESHER